MPLQPGSDNNRKKIILGESGCHVRTIAKDTEDAKRNEGTRIVAAGCHEANTEGKIGPSHFETNEN